MLGARLAGPLADRLTGYHRALDKVGVDLYLDQQNIDTTTPTGKLPFSITGAFAEFERSMIRQRVHAGLNTMNTIKAKIARDGEYKSKAGVGVVRKRLGRPNVPLQRSPRRRSCCVRAKAF